MKILIIVPKYTLKTGQSYDYYFPFGLGYISAVLKNAGYEVHCLNLNHINGKVEKIIKSHLDFNEYDFVCTGNNAMGYIITEKILNAVRKHKSNPKIILGGPIITTEPELIFNSLKPDFGVIGEGEETIIQLVECLNENKDLKEVKGIIYKNNLELVKTEKREAVEDLNSLPIPDFEGIGFAEQIKNMHGNYVYYTLFNNPKVYPILGSRSCPFQCTFCYHDSKYRKRSIDNIMMELNLMVKRHKINVICIYDECFALNKERLLEFCEKINKLREEISWELQWQCQLIVNTVNDDILNIMKNAGCYLISYGFESYSPIVLKSMRKYITPEQIDIALKKTLEHGIVVQANFIFGDIAETSETANVTLDYWEKNCKGQVFLDFIQPYPGSQIYKHCLEKGLIKDKLDFMKNKIGTDSLINMTNNMSNEEMEVLRKKVFELSSKYRIYIQPLSIHKIKFNTYLIKIKCPFCQEIVEYENMPIFNKYNYGLYVLCQKCHMRLTIVSLFQKMVYNNYSKLDKFVSFYLSIRKKLKTKRL